MEITLTTMAAVFFSSIAAGMGLGGGTVLLLYLSAIGIPQQTAQGLNLLLFLPGAAAALLLHHKNGLLRPKALKVCLPAGIGGGILGSLLGNRVPSFLLRKAFGVLLLAAAARELWTAWKIWKESST